MVTLQERVRRDNLRMILDLLRRRDGISQIELVRETELRASTVSNLVRDLRSRRCVRTIGHGESGLAGGKPPVMIGLEPRRGVYLGLLWDAGSISAALVDFSGSVVGTVHSVSIELSHRDAADSAAIIDQLVDLAATCRGPNLMGVGLAVGSVVDDDGTVHPSVDFPWHVPTAPEVLRRRLSLSDGIPVAVENDANCVALDVRRLLPEIPETILALVVTEAPYSAGAGIMVRDRLVRGRSGSTGELLVDGHSHSIGDLDTACGTAIRMIDPDYLALALPPTIPPEDLAYTYAAIGDRSVQTLDQSRAALFGAAYLAHREHIERIIEGGV
jgi:hypothetical protein